MQVTVPDDLAAAARLSELSDQEAQRAWIIGLLAEQRLSLVQAARFAGLDRVDFQRRLAARFVILDVGKLEAVGGTKGAVPADRPWLALRGSARFVGDPFAPVVPEEEITVLQKRGSGAGS